MAVVGGVAALVALGLTQGATAQAPQDLAGLTLEQLAEIEVTSVSRRPEPLSQAAAAVYVITREDIRRSGAASLPEVLRLAPNLQVQRINSADYAISARGFNSFDTANKLLVLIDGRSIYTPQFSGVLWDGQGLVLEDIERIEVISGPGGSLYGANAVNGVINITTRAAADTTGPALSVGVGDEDRVVSARYGDRFGSGAWRLAVTAFDRNDTRLESGVSARDQTAGVRISGRVDWTDASGDWTLLGDVYNHGVANDIDLTGGFAQAGWRRSLGRYGELQAQAYYDRTKRLGDGSDETINTWDIEAQHAFDLGRHTLVWGAGYRVVDSTVFASKDAGYLDPPSRRITLGNLFLQDQITLTSRLTLTLGAKLEDSSFTGAEVLPNVRLAWNPHDGALAWGAISRAARTASRVDRDLNLPGFLVGGDFESEMVTAYELGYRARPTPNLSFSVSAFYNDYDDLRTIAPQRAPPHSLSFANGGTGHSTGVEAWASYDVTPQWRLNAGVSTLDKSFRVKAGQVDFADLASVGDDPEYQVLLGSRSQLTDDIDLDVRLRGVGDLPMSGIDAYVEADVRIGWRVADNLELAVTGSNLLENERLETGDLLRRRLLGRSVFMTLKTGF